MIERLKKILQLFIREYVVNNEETTAILFTLHEYKSMGNDIAWRTLEQLKPIYDQFGGKLKFDETDEEAKKANLPIYMPLEKFAEQFPLNEENLSDDDLLLEMIRHDNSQRLGHHVFLRYLNEKRNS